MPGLETLLFLVLSFVATFSLGRFLSRRWRQRDQERAQAARAPESRQVRRAQERKRAK